MHEIVELTGIALIVVVAALIGLGMVRLRQPPVVGYILTGVILGPSAFGLVENRDAIALLAELGVIMLLYFIGMELSLRTFRLIWVASVTAVVGQTVAGILAMALPGLWYGWPVSWWVLGGFCLALSSTAVAVKIVDEIGAQKTRVGRSTIGILVAQDLAVAPMLLVIGGLSAAGGGVADSDHGGGGVMSVAIQLILSVVILAGVTIFLSRREKVSLPWIGHVKGRTDLLPLISLAWCFGLATVAGLIGLSPAFGAFMAGLIVGNSSQREIFHHSTEPVQAILLMVFFLSVGLLLDLGFVWDNIILLLVLWALVLVFKTFSNAVLARILGLSWPDAFTVALVIGQLGEFSFVLGAAALAQGAIDSDVHRIIVALTVLSLATSPLYVQLARRNRHRAMRHINGLKAMLRLTFFFERRASLHFGHRVVKGSARLTRSGKDAGRKIGDRLRSKAKERKTKERKTGEEEISSESDSKSGDSNAADH